MSPHVQEADLIATETIDSALEAAIENAMPDYEKTLVDVDRCATCALVYLAMLTTATQNDDSPYFDSPNDAARIKKDLFSHREEATRLYLRELRRNRPGAFLMVDEQ